MHGFDDYDDMFTFDKATDSYVKNVDGAVFDSFTVRRRDVDSYDKILFCCQQKAYIVETVSAKLIEEEIMKVRVSIPKGLRFQLVVIASNVNTDICKNLPEECIVLTGPALEKFYSIFSARAKLLLDCQARMNINTASECELRTVNQLGKFIAESIISSREKKFFCLGRMYSQE